MCMQRACVATLRRPSAKTTVVSFPMLLDDFLSRLAADGVAVVTADEELTVDEEWRGVVRGWDAVQRRELAFTAPALSLAAAEWAAVRLYRGCQSLICRQVAPQDLRRFFAEPCPE